MAGVVVTRAAVSTGNDDEVGDDASDDSTPPPPPPRPNTLTPKVATTTDATPKPPDITPVTTPAAAGAVDDGITATAIIAAAITPTTTTAAAATVDHPMYVALDACASAAYVAFSSLSLVTTSPSQSPPIEQPPPDKPEDENGVPMDSNDTSVGNIGDGNNNGDGNDNHDGNDNSDDEEVGVPIVDRRYSEASMLTPPSPAPSQLPSPALTPVRNNSHSRNPNQRCQKASTRPLSSTIIPAITTQPQLPSHSTSNDRNRIVHHSTSAGGRAKSSSSNANGRTSSSASSSASSSRVLGPTFSDLMRRFVSQSTRPSIPPLHPY